jgi:hypothetical protein
MAMRRIRSSGACMRKTAHRGRFYPHQWPRGATQAIIEFFDMLVG